ncbi:hypothetical protein J1614_004429 [Plenodomus biglobosus]|nr:hypothetical protein J1614_004429 [Plenodomus biglobosus]
MYDVDESFDAQQPQAGRSNFAAELGIKAGAVVQSSRSPPCAVGLASMLGIACPRDQGHVNFRHSRNIPLVITSIPVVGSTRQML